MNFYKVNDNKIINLDLITSISRVEYGAMVYFSGDDILKISKDECDELEEYLFEGVEE